ncbi:hypothetical protein P5V15_007649 [Pogonomyrmex californicus]
MPKKGKKKKTTDASTSKDASEEKSQQQTLQQKEQTSLQHEVSPSTSQAHQKQTTSDLPQQQRQQVSSAAPAAPKLQGAWATRQQQHEQVSQQQGAMRAPQQVPSSVSQQQGALGPRPQQQQTPPSVSQQQGTWGPRPQQQQQALPPVSQQQGAWGLRPQQQQISSSISQQQGAQGPRLQQQQAPSVSQQQGAWGARPQQQQAPPPVSQQQGTWDRQPQQQQTPPSVPQKQGAWGPRPQQQQIPSSISQQQGAQGPRLQQQQAPSVSQQQGAWGARPQQQQAPPPVSQQQGTWDRQPQQQQTPPSVPQKQGAWGPRPQQQQASSFVSQQQGAQGPQLQQQQAPSVSQQQGAWGARPQQQQTPPSVLQQQGTSAPQSQWQQQQHQAAWNQQQPTWWGLQQVPQIGGSGDQVQAIDKNVQQQPSTSAELVETGLEQLSLSKKNKEKGIDYQKEFYAMIPKRKNPLQAGLKGTPITVWTNMFKIIFDKNFISTAVHYDVDIQPKIDKKKGALSKASSESTTQPKKLPKALQRIIFEKFRIEHCKNRYPAFDGNKNAYSAKNLPFDEISADIEIQEEHSQRTKLFKITLKRKEEIDLKWLQNLRPGINLNPTHQIGVQVLDIIMRHQSELQNFSVGRSLFWIVPSRYELGNGLSLGQGGFQSGIAGWNPYLNIDVSHKGFPTNQTVLACMAEFARVDDKNQLTAKNINSIIMSKLNRFLKGLKIIYEIPNVRSTKRTYRIKELSTETSMSYTFSEDDSSNFISIYEYFRKRKNYKICYPNLPVVLVGKVNNKNIYLPAELCTIISKQNYNKKLDEQQTAKMIRMAATSAPDRKQRIEEAFQKIGVNNSPVMRNEFHLSINSEMERVQARILTPPTLKYAERTERVWRGTWQAQAFNRAKNLESSSWTIFNLSGISNIHPRMDDFVKDLKQQASYLGMQIGDPVRPFQFIATRPIDKNEIIHCFQQKNNLKLIIVIIPDFTNELYGIVKQITELRVGVLTQCMKLKTLQRSNPTTVKNILLKINSKLNGINHMLSQIPSSLQNAMLIGADVTHPSPDAQNIPSIAAVATSIDTSTFQYNIALRLQPPKQEMIDDLENIILEQLMMYEKKTSRPPKKIIYYRDGVSEGQLPQVMYHEITAIKKACRTFNRGNIQVNCLIVQKRHHIRFFPTNPKETDDKHGNVKAGTIVDTTITHPDHIDFYLTSHASIQGTSRPTKYRCICNESGFSEDDIEEMTYFLCHMYARCTRSVSYPTPTYYAHLAAYRGRAFIQGVPINLNNLEAQQKILEMKMPESPMYFV